MFEGSDLAKRLYAISIMKCLLGPIESVQVLQLSKLGINLVIIIYNRNKIMQDLFTYRSNNGFVGEKRRKEQ